jgi:hypothetical protein
VGRAHTIVLLAAAALVMAGCAPPVPGPVRFAAVALPAGTRPEVLAAAGDALLVGVARDGAATRPGLLRLGPDRTVAEVPVQAATGYGHTATWYALAADAGRVLAVGGDRGGAHGNVRWTVWTGTRTGVTERPQTFATFGGWGAGDLVGAVLTPSTPMLVGHWQSDAAGLDVAVWTPAGDTWHRRGSTGTALANTPAHLGFARSATGHGDGALIVGWRAEAGRQVPTVWRSTRGAEGWSATVLPEPGAGGAAISARCGASGCVVAGRVDGNLALWRLSGGTWTRIPGVPAVPLTDADPLPGPLHPDTGVDQVVPDRGRLALLHDDGAAITLRPLSGPVGPAHQAVAVGSTDYLLAGDPPALWRTDGGAPAG